MPAIKLLHAHTHAGQPYAAGAVVDVDVTTASWLAAHGVGDPVTDNPPPESRPTAAGEPAAATTRARRFYPPRTAESDTHGDDHER